MGTGQTNPSLRAAGSIGTYRAVIMHSVANQAVVAADASASFVGVTDGSNIEFDEDNHALTGDAVRLQAPNVMKIQCGEAVAVGDLLTGGAGGFAAVAIVTDVHTMGVAMEPGLTGEVIDFLWQPCRGVGA